VGRRRARQEGRDIGEIGSPVLPLHASECRNAGPRIFFRLILFLPLLHYSSALTGAHFSLSAVGSTPVWQPLDAAFSVSYRVTPPPPRYTCAVAADAAPGAEPEEGEVVSREVFSARDPLFFPHSIEKLPL